MTRQNILLIAGAAALAVAVLIVALLLGNNQGEQEPEETPAPMPTTTLEPAPTSTPTPIAEEPSEPGHQGEEDPHTHGEAPEDCDTGPVACDGATDMVQYGEGDREAADAVRTRVTQFAAAWTTVNSSESSKDRTARLENAGATAEAAATVPTLARANSVQIGLTVATKPRPAQRTMFVEREDGLLKFKVALDVDATYMQPDGTGSRQVAGGQVIVYITDDGSIVRVEDSFPTIDGLR